MNHELIKNMTIISQLIEMGDEETLAPLLRKSKDGDTEGTFKYLWHALENRRYDDALILIKDVEAQSRQVAVVYDPIVSALKVELHFQESELSFLTSDRDEMATRIEQFQIRYDNATRAALGELLLLRKQKLAIQAAIDPRMKAMSDAAEKAYAAFEESANSPVKGLLYRLNEAELKEIKTLYRRASMICHPDRVADEFKERAEAMFAELHEAYTSNDLRKVRLITELLVKTGQFEPMSSRLDNAEALRTRINWVLLHIEQIEADVREIEASEAHFTVQSVGENWAQYLADVVGNLRNQIVDLKKWHLTYSNNN